MKYTFIQVVTLMSLGLWLMSCSGSSSSSFDSADTVTVAMVKMTDTTSFTKSNGEKCQIFAESSFNYPTSYRNKELLAALQRLYAQNVLEAPDSLSLNDAMRACVANSLKQYEFSDSILEDEDLTDYPPQQTTIKYNTSINVIVHYKARGIFNVCRVEVVKKNDKISSVTHRYYTFDLDNMKRVGLNDLFAENCINEVTKLLRTSLLEQNKVKTDEELNDLGYFNIDNLSATDNFCFDADGLTWSFLPNQLAVYAVGEPRVTIDYRTLLKLASEKSTIRRMI